MNFRNLLFLCLFVGTLCPPPVFANGPYVGIETGLAISSSSSFVHSISTLVIATGEAELSSGYAIGGVAGYRFSKLRIEGELAYRNNDFDRIMLTAPVTLSTPAKGQVSVTSLFLNAYYDIKLSGRVSPYIGIGAGYSWVTVDLEEQLFDLKLIDNENDSCPAVQFILGTGITVTPQIIMDIGYRYVLTGPIAIAGLSTADYSVSNYGSHNFMIGARYNF